MFEENTSSIENYFVHAHDFFLIIAYIFNYSQYY